MLSQAFKITIFRPSQVTWFYKLKKWWRNWVVPVTLVAWPGIKGLFFDVAPAVIDQVSQIADRVQQAKNEPSGISGDAVLTNSLVAAGAYFGIGISASAIIPVVLLLKTIGPVLLKMIQLYDMYASVRSLMEETCLQMHIEMTDDFRLATHTMRLICREAKAAGVVAGDEVKVQKDKDNNVVVVPTTRTDAPAPTPTSTSSCSTVDRLIRFVPLPITEQNKPTGLTKLIRDYIPKWFQDSGGAIDISVVDMLKVMDLPAEFIASETEAENLLRKEFGTHHPVLTNRAYEAFETLQKMIEMY